MFALSINGGIARLRMTRPEARNAIPLDGWSALADRAEEAAVRGASVLVLGGEPGGGAHGVLQDDEQGSVFDALLGSDALFERLSAHRNRARP